MDTIEKEARAVGYEYYIHPFGLTQQQAKLLAVLMDVPIATAEIIQQRVKMSTETKVAIHRLRARMTKYNITISAKRYRGFWLDDAEKDKIKKVVVEH